MNKPVPNFGRRSRQTRTVDMLSAAEEQHLIRAWQDRGDQRARDRLIRAFAPLAASVTKRYKPGLGEADHDLLQEANVGLMKAADRFDPERENRFSTYAVWWVRAEVQAFTRANSSIVRRPNSAQARKAATQIAAMDAEIKADPRIDRAEAEARLAEEIGVSIERISELREQTTGRDYSLNTPALGDSGEERIAMLVDPESLEEPTPLQQLETDILRRELVDALSTLPVRERDILIATQLHDPPATLERLGEGYGISKERVRQLRERGFERLRENTSLQNLGESYFT